MQYEYKKLCYLKHYLIYNIIEDHLYIQFLRLFPKSVLRNLQKKYSIFSYKVCNMNTRNYAT